MVRARLIAKAADWRWASTAAHLGGLDDGLVDPRPLREFMPDPQMGGPLSLFPGDTIPIPSADLTGLGIVSLEPGIVSLEPRTHE